MFLLLGLGAGAVYAAVGLGLVLTFRASGVVNFAHGAMAMYATYVFTELRASGDLVVPPVRVHLLDRAPVALAMVLALTCAGVLGLAAYGLVFRPLRQAPALARVVASVGLMISLQAVVTLQFGTANRAVPGLLPSRPVRLLGEVVPSDRLELAALVLAAAAALGAVFRYTTFGLATRAAVDDEVGVALLGWSPDLLAAVNWALAAVVAGLGGILVGPITGLNPVTYTLLVVPALAAALVGRLTSFGVTAACALALGMAQSELVRLQSRFSWVPRLGVREAVPLAVIVATMAWRGSLVPERSAPEAQRLPAAGLPRRHLRLAAGAVPLAALALAGLHGGYRLGLITSMVAAVICLSIVVLTGYTGQISLAQMAFAGVAGFSLSRLSADLGVPFPLAPLLAAVAAGLVGLLIGLPARRGRGVNLAVVTLAAAVVVEQLVFENSGFTGGLAGSRVPDPAVLGLHLGIGGRRPGDFPSVAFGLVALAVLTITAVGVAELRTRGLGRRLLAVRGNERAAAAAGIDVGRTKLAAFVLSAFIAGIGGALVGYQQRSLSVESFGVFISLAFLAVTYLGGIAGVTGALVGGALASGGIVFAVLDDTAGLGRYQLLASGLGLVVVAVLSPDGVTGAASRLAARLATRVGPGGGGP